MFCTPPTRLKLCSGKTTDLYQTLKYSGNVDKMFILFMSTRRGEIARSVESCDWCICTDWGDEKFKFQSLSRLTEKNDHTYHNYCDPTAPLLERTFDNWKNYDMLMQFNTQRDVTISKRSCVSDTQCCTVLSLVWLLLKCASSHWKIGPIGQPTSPPLPTAANLKIFVPIWRATNRCSEDVM